MSLYRSLVRPLAFRMDPETIHERAMWLLRHGLIRVRTFEDPRLRQDLFGVKFPNPIGLAAGFDKNAVALNEWHRLGFGFVECGTVTFHAQPGNPKPRMFRVPDQKGLINRLGFNNQGAPEVTQRIRRSHPKIPLGINLGKSKVTELERATEDYRESYRLLHDLGDYFVINVSSPNTPGLRNLQEKSALLDIVGALRSVDPTRPLFVKVAPDLELSALDDVLEAAVSTGLTGLIATNTTIARDMLPHDPGETGGLSGAPLKKKSDEVLRHLATSAPEGMILMGVGGIMSGADAYRKILLGAHLCQLYTGWIYGGPQLIPQLLRDLVALMERDGFENLAQARGKAL